MNPAGHVAIVGGGFSGTLLAINLLRFAGPRATLIDRAADRIGRGVAYSATGADQLLNVRAGGMSAFPDDPGHFARWAAARGAGDAQSFVPRATYGAYLAETLAEMRVAQPGRLTLATGDVSDVGDGVTIADQMLAADSVVLATGNLPPHTPPGIDPARLPAGAYVGDPWRGDIAEGLRPDDVVVLIGTGLTAIDVALKLEAAGFAGPVLALSRRGMRPHRHLDGLPPKRARQDPPEGSLSALVAQVRAEAARDGWRVAVDALRPVTQRLWAASDDAVRARFLRHLRPYWDAHRHRLAPAVADRIDAMVADGRLRFAGGRIVEAVAHGAGVTLRWTPRHGETSETVNAARIVNCTGPQGDLVRSDDPLLRTLAARGAIRPDPLRLGIDVDAQSRVIRADGTPDPRLCCVGPMTRGGLWEVVAVPDLRVQSWTLARRLANAHWVGGEGL
ncbi:MULTISPECIES: FAD/NAD(P)-binding protein [unclassified Sphingomonas]|uniref:FAD/NAD(P)-binding protein n=1 Tax=unclassified Sphingomonas TaxID=196159 RepID=UPI0022698007